MKQREVHTEKLTALLEGATLRDDRGVRIVIEGTDLVWRSSSQSSKAELMLRINLNTCRVERRVEHGTGSSDATVGSRHRNSDVGSSCGDLRGSDESKKDMG